MRDLRVACVGLRGGRRGSGRSVAQLLVDGHRGDAVAANPDAGKDHLTKLGSAFND